MFMYPSKQPPDLSVTVQSLMLSSNPLHCRSYTDWLVATAKDLQGQHKHTDTIKTASSAFFSGGGKRILPKFKGGGNPRLKIGETQLPPSSAPPPNKNKPRPSNTLWHTRSQKFSHLAQLSEIAEMG